MGKNLREIQAEAMRQYGRELNDQELESFINMKVMEASFENIDAEHPDEKEALATISND